MSKLRLHHIVRTCWTLIVALTVCLPSAFGLRNAYADQAQVDLYFPYAILGGPESDQWTAEVVVSNTGYTDTSVDLEFISDTGSRHSQIIFVPSSQGIFSPVIPTGQTRRFVAKGYNSTRHLRGWIRGETTVPVVSKLILKKTSNGLLSQTVNVPAIRPAGGSIFQLINPTKVFLVNRDDTISLQVVIQVVSTSGQSIENRTVIVPPNSARNYVYEGTHTGTVDLSPSSSSGIYTLVAGAIPVIESSTPFSVAMSDGGYMRSIAHKEQLNYQYRVIEDTARNMAAYFSESYREEGDIYNANRWRYVFDDIHLEIPKDVTVNAYARHASTVGVSLGLVELLSDSPGELAFVIGHEFGHIFQQRTHRLENDPYNIEADADIWGAWFSLLSGHDVYASAGALSKLAMVTGNSSLANQIFEDVPYFEAHRSINTRMTSVFDMLVRLCGDPSVAQTCAEYKRVLHPNLPSIAPLDDDLNLLGLE